MASLILDASERITIETFIETARDLFRRAAEHVDDPTLCHEMLEQARYLDTCLYTLTLGVKGSRP